MSNHLHLSIAIMRWKESPPPSVQYSDSQTTVDQRLGQLSSNLNIDVVAPRNFKKFHSVRLCLIISWPVSSSLDCHYEVKRKPQPRFVPHADSHTTVDQRCNIEYPQIWPVVKWPLHRRGYSTQFRETPVSALSPLRDSHYEVKRKPSSVQYSAKFTRDG